MSWTQGTRQRSPHQANPYQKPAALHASQLAKARNGGGPIGPAPVHADVSDTASQTLSGWFLFMASGVTSNAGIGSDTA